MVAGVCVQRRKNREGEPKVSGSHMRAHEEHAEEGRKQVRADVLERMAIHRGDSYGRSPLVMLLMYVLVQDTLMEESAKYESVAANWCRQHAMVISKRRSRIYLCE